MITYIPSTVVETEYLPVYRYQLKELFTSAEKAQEFIDALPGINPDALTIEDALVPPPWALAEALKSCTLADINLGNRLLLAGLVEVVDDIALAMEQEDHARNTKPGDENRPPYPLPPVEVSALPPTSWDNLAMQTFLRTARAIVTDYSGVEGQVMRVPHPTPEQWRGWVDGALWRKLRFFREAPISKLPNEVIAAWIASSQACDGWDEWRSRRFPEVDSAIDEHVYPGVAALAPGVDKDLVRGHVYGHLWEVSVSFWNESFPEETGMVRAV